MSYPTPPSVPAFISVTPTNIAIAFGTTVQLVPILTDVNRNVVSATKPFTYSSSNDALLIVSSSGLCTAVTPADPNALNEGGTASVTVSYPNGNRTTGETIQAVSVVQVQADAVKTQIIVRGIPASTGLGSGNLVPKIVPASAPAPSYPPGWVIAGN